MHAFCICLQAFNNAFAIRDCIGADIGGLGRAETVGNVFLGAGLDVDGLFRDFA
jgi:hypothetical protein